MVATHSGRCYAVNVTGVDSQFYKKPFGRQIDDMRLIRSFKADARSVHVNCKRLNSKTEVNRWIRQNCPSQYYAAWIADCSTWKDDSVEVYYLT